MRQISDQIFGAKPIVPHELARPEDLEGYMGKAATQRRENRTITVDVRIARDHS